MKGIAILVAAAVGVAGCGADEQKASPPAQVAASATPTATASPEPTPTPRRGGTEIVLGDSQFGDILFDSRRQAIYVFERDRRDETACYGECAEAWPPGYTDAAPVAGRGENGRASGRGRV